MRLFNKFGDIDQLAVNKIVEWAYEKGKADAIGEVNELVVREKSRMASTFDFSKYWK